VRFDCKCGEVYFVSWVENDSYWSRGALDSGSWKEPTYVFQGKTFKNEAQGRFAFETPDWRDKSKTLAQNTGCFTLDLSHYETYNDEPMDDGPEKAAIQNGEQSPRYLCTDDAEDVQWVWGK
jgi:hypothetical protein